MSCSSKWNVAVIGECMIELREENGGMVQSFGGDTLNMSAYLARLCKDEANVEYVSAVGDDEIFSPAMLNFWQECGVKSTLTQRIAEKLPGLYAINVDASGERHFQYWRNEAAVRSTFSTPNGDAVLEKLADFDLIYLSGISLAVLYPDGREKLMLRLEELARSGVRIAFDFNYRARLWSNETPREVQACYERIAKICHTVFLSLEEGAVAGCADQTYSPQLVSCLRAFGAKETVIKDSGVSVLVLGQKAEDDTLVQLEQIDKPLDSTAAGDSFAAGYLAARHKGFSTSEAVERAHLLSSAVIMHRGAIMPEAATPNIFVKKSVEGQDSRTTSSLTC